MNISKSEFYNGNKAKKKNRLVDISVDEISIVDLACVGKNGKNFVLFKKLEKDLQEGNVSLEDLNADEIEKELLEQIDSMPLEEAQETLESLEWLLVKYQVEKLSQSIEALKESDPAMADELDRFPENFDVSEDFVITRKSSVRSQKPEKYWDEYQQKWITKKAGWKEYKDDFGRRYWKKEQGGN